MQGRGNKKEVAHVRDVLGIYLVASVIDADADRDGFVMPRVTL